MEDFREAREQLESRVDIVWIRKKLNDLELIKKILFSEEKEQLIRIMKKPTIQLIDYHLQEQDRKRDKLTAKMQSIFLNKMKLKQVDDAQCLYDSYKARLDDFKSSSQDASLVQSVFDNLLIHEIEKKVDSLMTDTPQPLFYDDTYEKKVIAGYLDKYDLKESEKSGDDLMSDHSDPQSESDNQSAL